MEAVRGLPQEFKPSDLPNYWLVGQGPQVAHYFNAQREAMTAVGPAEQLSAQDRQTLLDYGFRKNPKVNGYIHRGVSEVPIRTGDITYQLPIGAQADEARAIVTPQRRRHAVHATHVPGKGYRISGRHAEELGLAPPPPLPPRRASIMIPEGQPLPDAEVRYQVRAAKPRQSRAQGHHVGSKAWFRVLITSSLHRSLGGIRVTIAKGRGQRGGTDILELLARLYEQSPAIAEAAASALVTMAEEKYRHQQTLTNQPKGVGIQAWMARAAIAIVS